MTVSIKGYSYFMRDFGRVIQNLFSNRSQISDDSPWASWFVAVEDKIFVSEWEFAKSSSLRTRNAAFLASQMAENFNQIMARFRFKGNMVELYPRLMS